MILTPIELDPASHAQFQNDPRCTDILSVYPDFYEKVGFQKPWIGYFSSHDGKQMLGCGGFKGAPENGRVEIAYYIFPEFEGRGLGTELCKELVSLALSSEPGILVTARTLMEENASTSILKKNGFDFKGVLEDKDDGDVWEWHYVVQ